MALIVATYVCHAACLQRRTVSARTSLGPTIHDFFGGGEVLGENPNTTFEGFSMCANGDTLVYLTQYDYL